MKIRAQVFVSGDVQGVFFRSSVRTEARMLGVFGWVRNLPDGRVELMVEGERKGVESLIEYCRHGPPGAGVDDVKVVWKKPTHQFSSFEIAY